MVIMFNKDAIHDIPCMGWGWGGGVFKFPEIYTYPSLDPQNSAFCLILRYMTRIYIEDLAPSACEG